MDNELIHVLNDHVNKYPFMQLEDYFKLCYQYEFGPSHLLTINDFDKVFKSLKEEAINNPNKKKEKIYIGNGFYRCNLVDDDNYLKKIAIKFIDSCKNKTGDINHFYNLLLELYDYISIKDLTKEDYLKIVEKYKKEGFKPVSHSHIYKEMYNPCYRVVKE